MALIRGFAQIDEEGRIPIPRSVYIHLGLKGEEAVQVDVVSIKRGTRRSRLMVHPAGYGSRISPLESVIACGLAHVDGEEAVIPEEELLSFAGFAPGDHLEMKMQGTARQPCLAVYHRVSPVRLSGRDTVKHRGKRVRSMKLNY